MSSPQHRQHTLTPSRSRSGSVSDAHLLQLAHHLTERDHYLLTMLADHQVLTTAQITEIAFTGRRRAEQRLTQLFTLGVLDRFRPFTPIGTTPFHWVLGTAGVHVYAARTGIDPAKLGALGRRGATLAHSQRLAHTVGVNGFFTALIKTSRDTQAAVPQSRPAEQAGLIRVWWSERQCARAWGQWARPDGYGQWNEAGLRLAFFLEYDTGAETLSRLADKLRDYQALTKAAGPAQLLFTFLSARRETNAQRVLTGTTLQVATTTLRPGTTPAGPVWSMVGRDGPPVRLAQLADPELWPTTST